MILASHEPLCLDEMIILDYHPEKIWNELKPKQLSSSVSDFHN